jgi:DNA-binding XRE family transcriptional regulator
VEYEDHILNETIRQVFLDCRRESGLTQNTASLQSNITRQFISQVEVGKRMPSITTLSALARVYNKSLSELFKEVDRLYPLVANAAPIFEISADIAAETKRRMSEYIESAKKSKDCGAPMKSKV